MNIQNFFEMVRVAVDDVDGATVQCTATAPALTERSDFSYNADSFIARCTFTCGPIQTVWTVDSVGDEDPRMLQEVLSDILSALSRRSLPASYLPGVVSQEIYTVSSGGRRAGRNSVSARQLSTSVSTRVDMENLMLSYFLSVEGIERAEVSYDMRRALFEYALTAHEVPSRGNVSVQVTEQLPDSEFRDHLQDIANEFLRSVRGEYWGVLREGMRLFQTAYTSCHVTAVRGEASWNLHIGLAGTGSVAVWRITDSSLSGITVREIYDALENAYLQHTQWQRVRRRRQHNAELPEESQYIFSSAESDTFIQAIRDAPNAFSSIGAAAEQAASEVIALGMDLSGLAPPKFRYHSICEVKDLVERKTNTVIRLNLTQYTDQIEIVYISPFHGTRKERITADLARQLSKAQAMHLLTAGALSRDGRDKTITRKNKGKLALVHDPLDPPPELPKRRIGRRRK